MPSEAIRAHLRQFFRVKQCLHPQASSGACGKIVGAHTIQRKGPLADIVDDGEHVLSFYPPSLNRDESPRRVGWREASTFAGFCDRHDSQAFRPLEQGVFTGSDEQCFLLAYRAVCHELYQKQAADKSQDLRRQLLDRGEPPEVQGRIQHLLGVYALGVAKGLDDVRLQKQRMDLEFLERRFDGWRRLFVVFDGPLFVVSAGVPTPNRDFANHELQCLHIANARIQPLFFGPARTENGGVWVFMWRPEDPAPSRFLQDFLDVPSELLPSMLVQMIFAYIENTFFAPAWWSSLKRPMQTHLARLARMGNPYYDEFKYLRDTLMPWRSTGIVSDVFPASAKRAS